MKIICTKLGVLALTATFALPLAHAAGFTVTESKPISELWINPGLYSVHFQRDKGFNDNNFGFGVEYRYSTVSSVTAGVIDNSDRRTSHYAGWYWQPVSLGPVRLGGVVGVIDGYPKFHDGGWFPAVLPAASVEYKRVGLNVLVIPTYKDRVHGAISFQLKLKVF
jgi:hypothetical protein